MGTIEAAPRPRSGTPSSSEFFTWTTLAALVAGACAFVGQATLAGHLSSPAPTPAPPAAVERARANRERAKWLLQRADEFGDVYQTAELTPRIALGAPVQRLQDILRGVRTPAEDWNPRFHGADLCRQEFLFVMGVRALKLSLFMAQSEMEGMEAVAEHDPGAWKDAEDCAKSLLEKADRFNSIVGR